MERCLVVRRYVGVGTLAYYYIGVVTDLLWCSVLKHELMKHHGMMACADPAEMMTRLARAHWSSE